MWSTLASGSLNLKDHLKSPKMKNVSVLCTVLWNHLCIFCCQLHPTPMTSWAISEVSNIVSLLISFRRQSSLNWLFTVVTNLEDTAISRDNVFERELNGLVKSLEMRLSIISIVNYISILMAVFTENAYVFTQRVENKWTHGPPGFLCLFWICHISLHYSLTATFSQIVWNQQLESVLFCVHVHSTNTTGTQRCSTVVERSPPRPGSGHQGAPGQSVAVLGGASQRSRGSQLDSGPGNKWDSQWHQCFSHPGTA